MNKLHNFLQTTKGRIIFILIPGLICATGIGFIFAHIVFNFLPIPTWIANMYILNASIMLINLGLIIWSDNKK